MKDFNGINSPFKDAIMPVHDMAGDNVNESNGATIRDGQTGTARTMPEVTGVTVRDADSPAKPYNGKGEGILGGG